MTNNDYKQKKFLCDGVSSKLALGWHSLSKPNLAAYSFTLSVGHGHEVNIVVSSTASLEDQ